MSVPRSSFTQAQLRDRVRGDMGLRSNNLLTDTDINSWGLEGQNKLARLTGWLRVTGATQGTTANQKEYDLPNVAGVGTALRIEEVLHLTLPLKLVTVNELQRWSYYWRRDAAATPLFYYVRGATQFGLHPTPINTDATALQVIWTGIPPAPTGDSDTYYCPYSGEEAIIAYCKLCAAEKDASGEGAHRMLAYRQTWKELVLEVKQEVESVAFGEAAIMGVEGDVPRSLRPWGFDPYQIITGPS